MDDEPILSVAELIAHLQTLPQDAVPIFSMCSDYETFRKDEIRFVPKEEKKFIYREENGYTAYKSWWFPKDEIPDFRNVVRFPGN